MYIPPTTCDDRLALFDLMGGTMSDIALAVRRLDAMWEDHFGMSDPEPLTSNQIEEISDMIRLCSSTIWNAVLEYSLLVGDRLDDGFRGASLHKESLKRIADADRMNRLYFEAIKREKGIPTNQVEEYRARYMELMQKPDAEAIPAMEALLNSEKEVQQNG